MFLGSMDGAGGEDGWVRAQQQAKWKYRRQGSSPFGFYLLWKVPVFFLYFYPFLNWAVVRSIQSLWCVVS